MNDRRALEELKQRVQSSAHYQDRASKKMLLALITIVYRLVARIEQLEGK